MASSECRRLQLLFVVDVTEKTGASWLLLHRACLAIVQACTANRTTTLSTGLLTVRSHCSVGPLFTPSGFTSDLAQLRLWLRGVLFDGGVGTAALFEGLLVAASEDLWEASSERHVVLVTHSEPRPLPALCTAATPPFSRSGSGCGAMSLASPWSPVPETVASARVSLSLVAPRSLPLLEMLRLAVFRAATHTPPRAQQEHAHAQKAQQQQQQQQQAHPRVELAPREQTRFDEFPELYVVSPLLPVPLHLSSAGTHPRLLSASVSPAGSASSEVPPLLQPQQHGSKRRCGVPSSSRLGSSGGSGRGGGEGNVCFSPPPLSAGWGGSGGSGDLAARFEVARGCGPAVELWSGVLTVTLPGGASVDLGSSSLVGEGHEEETAKWQAEAQARWGSSLRVHVLDVTQRYALLNEIASERERDGTAAVCTGGAGCGGGAGACAELALRLSVTRGRGPQLFARLHSQGVWAQLLIPTHGYCAFIEPSESSELRGWVLRRPQ